MIVWGSHIDVKVSVLDGRMVSGALDDGDANAVVEAITVGLTGVVAGPLVIAGAEGVVVGAVAIDAGVEALAVEASEMALDADTEDPEPTIADPDRLPLAVFVLLPELAEAERTVWLGPEPDTDPVPVSVALAVEEPERPVGRDADGDVIPDGEPDEKVMPDAKPVDEIPFPLEAGVIIEPGGDVKLPVPVADTDVSLEVLLPPAKSDPVLLNIDPVGKMLLLGDARMLEMMLARAVVPALEPEIVDVAEAPAESTPELPDPVTPETVVGKRSELSPPTSEDRMPLSEADAEAEAAVIGAVPDRVGAATELLSTEPPESIVGALPRAVVTPDTTELRREPTPGRRPESVAEPAAVDPPVPE